jgi:hypothetical protein
VQNGVLKNELLRAVFGYSRVLGAMADFSGELLANGEVKFTRNVLPAPRREKGGIEPRAQEHGRAHRRGGVAQRRRRSNIRTREWSKFAGWIAQFPLAVLTRQITWKFLMDERSAMVIVRIVREAAALAAAMKIELTDMPPLPVPSIVHASDAQAIEIVRGIGQKFLDTRPSTACRRSRMCCAAAGSNTRRRWATRSQKAREHMRADAHARRPATASSRWRTREGLSRIVPFDTLLAWAADPRQDRAPSCSPTTSSPTPRPAARRSPGAKSHLQVRRRHPVDAAHAFSGRRPCTSSRRAARSIGAATSRSTCEIPCPRHARHVRPRHGVPRRSA